MRDVFAKIMDLLDPRERRAFWGLMALSAAMGVANMVGVASVIPFLALLADPEGAAQSRWLAPLVEGAGLSDAHGLLAALGALAALAYLGAVAVRITAIRALRRFAALRTHTIERRVLDHFLRQPYAWFLTRHSAEILQTALFEVNQMVQGVLLKLLDVCANAFVACALIALLVAINPWATLVVFLVVGGGYAAAYALVRARTRQLGAERYAAMQARLRIAQDAIAGIKEVKTLGLEPGALRRFDDPSRRGAEAMAAEITYMELPRHLLEAIAVLAMLGVMLGLAAFADPQAGGFAGVVPTAGAYALAGVRLAPSMQAIYAGLSSIRMHRGVLDAIHDAVSAPTVESLETEEIPPLADRLDLRGVVFAYETAARPALDGLDLTIRAGTRVGVVGGTGAGKTTTVDLILGLLAPSAGEIAVDGRPLRTPAERRGWRRTLGYVPQHIFLVDAPVAENIAFGVPPGEIDMDAVHRAARAAALHDFVTRDLPHGYATPVGDRGVRLSGGQRQRVGIARALYRDPALLILDEATSALDPITEAQVIAAIEATAVTPTRTVVMIAHRLSSVRRCDEIVLLDHGRVAARGSYDELIERSPIFREMTRASA